MELNIKNDYEVIYNGKLEWGIFFEPEDVMIENFINPIPVSKSGKVQRLNYK